MMITMMMMMMLESTSTDIDNNTWLILLDGYLLMRSSIHTKTIISLCVISNDKNDECNDDDNNDDHDIG